MRNITARELADLAKYYRNLGEEEKAVAYDVEEDKLQDEMNNDY